MAYQVLARKYRPQRFADVIGQDHVTQTLLNALAQDRIAHGYIFSGHRGIGKTTIARILAMALECRTPLGSAERPTPEPCGVCVACTEIRAGNAMDIIEIDAATNRGIDEIRELREGARYSPARDRYKIYILDEAHQITDAAFNALLKTLEEPPAHVIFMMATTQPEDIPQTIRSRCQHFSFHAVRFQEIVEQLRSIAEIESVNVDEAALSLLAEAGDGSMRDALSIMDQAIASAPLVGGRHVLSAAQIRSLMGSVSNQIFEDMLQAVKEQNAASMLEQAAQLLDAGNSPQQIARQMVRFLRNCLMARVAGTTSELLQVSNEERARAERIAAAFSEEDLARFLNAMLRTFDDLGYRQEQRFHLELGLLKLVHMQRVLPFEELFRQLSGGSRSSGSLAGNSSRGTPGPIGGKLPQVQGTRHAAPAENARQTGGATPAQPHPLDGMFSRPASSNTVAQHTPLPSETIAEPLVIFPAVQQPPSRPTPVPDSQSSIPVKDPAKLLSQDSLPPPQEAQTVDANVDAETLRIQISTALVERGHETAGTMFEAGVWQWDGTELRVQIGASKTLLGLIYTTQAQQIVREIFRNLTGGSRAVRVEPGEPSAQVAEKTVARASNPASGRPQDHPLIRHAQELFHAEVRSVVSLRDTR
ncbi:MAG TPA: DNA polymerase III subunit gamma/tau [Acidobacteriaceae bacterium]|nr:DNA polymerase III subunit gamma/tau [Acidobacteriaceae bacterium]